MSGVRRKQLAPAATNGDADDDGWSPPPKIEALYEKTDGNVFSAINRPTAGARSDEALPAGAESLQLYSLATPNGQKVGVLLEELGIGYDAHTISLAGGQFTSGFVAVNPNSKIPCAVDRAPADGGAPVRLFESGAIMLYLAEKHGRFLPTAPRARAECVAWLMWQMAGQGPMTGNFGHFMVYAPPGKREARDYAVARYGMEVQRLCATLDGHLADGRKYLCGDEYTVADMACLPWFQMLRTEKGYRHHSGVGAREFLSVANYEHAARWADRLVARPQVQRGLLVCRKHGKPWLHDDRFRHLAKL
eukprot:g8208.t1